MLWPTRSESCGPSPWQFTKPVCTALSLHRRASSRATDWGLGIGTQIRCLALPSEAANTTCGNATCDGGMVIDVSNMKAVDVEAGRAPPGATRLHLGRLRPRDTCMRSGHQRGLEHGRTSEDARLLACQRLTCVLARFICVPTRCSRSHFGRNTSRIDYSDTGAPVQGRRSPGSTSMVSHANVRHHAGLACSHYNIAARPFIRCGCRRSVAPEKRIPTTPRRRRRWPGLARLLSTSGNMLEERIHEREHAKCGQRTEPN